MGGRGTSSAATGAGEGWSPGGEPPDLVVHAAGALVGGGLRPATVTVVAGVVREVLPLDRAVRGERTLELARGEVLLPGLVDTHVHVNEPGRTEWEGFATATRAAAHGGVTTILDMPLNSLPPTLDPAALQAKRAAATAAGLAVDVGFWGGLVPANAGSVRALHEAGAFGVKAFLQDSGVPEFPPVDAAGLRRGMAQLAGTGSVVLVHAEDPAVLAAAPGPQGRSYPAFVASRPPAAEAAAVRTVVEAAAATGCRAHVVHVSSAAGVAVLRQAKAAGVPVTAETCPHYLALAAEDVPDGAPQFKCCPPVRGRADADALWEGLLDGTLDVVVSDHSPSTPQLKHLDTGDLGTAWGGISSLEVGLRVVWTAAHERGVGLDLVADLMARRTADLAGLPRKGRIAPGADADLVVFDPGAEDVLRAADLHHRHPVSPYEGMRVRGAVRLALLRGTDCRAGDRRGRLLVPERP
ncbi:allantoinase AllB [Kineococcus glutinatus]|uniref:allantoinase n=1 Tax=Kineococcus glutinatus TaxID=1070872 RepID=A0ABP9H757_9ACTN